MKRILVRVAVPFASAVLAFGVTPTAVAAPPHGDAPGAHIHHVHTGSGCIEIDAVTFLPLERGLHRGANESGHEHGPWHGPCH